jgi:hypothetical protein
MTEHDEQIENEDVEPELLPEREEMSIVSTDPYEIVPPDEVIPRDPGEPPPDEW